MLTNKHTKLFASILILVGILFFAVSPVMTASAALPAFQTDPGQDPPTDPVQPPDPVIVIPETGEQQQTVDASWIIWLVIGIVVIILLVALLARDRPRI
jgi:hypothetical protein